MTHLANYLPEELFKNFAFWLKENTEYIYVKIQIRPSCNIPPLVTFPYITLVCWQTEVVNRDPSPGKSLDVVHGLYIECFVAIIKEHCTSFIQH